AGCAFGLAERTVNSTPRAGFLDRRCEGIAPERTGNGVSVLAYWPTSAGVGAAGVGSGEAWALCRLAGFARLPGGFVARGGSARNRCEDA
ncbi:MAG: hypothetical protein ACLGGW_05780, partial [Gammaproteobacteria bacterium]